MAGFIVIDRKISDWKWWGNSTAMCLWLYILVGANWKDGHFMGVLIPRGSLATSLPRLAEETGLSESTIRRWLKRFENEGQIEQKVTNKYRVIKVLNYAKYQDIPDDRVNSQMNSQVTGQVNSQMTPNRTRITNKQEEPINNSRTKMPKPSLEEVKSYISEKGYAVDAEWFWSYYESNGWRVGKNPMKNWKAAISTWARSGHGKPSGTTIRVDTPQWHKDGKYNRQERQEVDEDLVAEIEQMRKEMKGEDND